MSDQVDHGAVSASPARGIAAQVVANTSLLIGILVYMGWSYEDAFFGYFNISPLDFDVGVLEYMLRSLSLFSPALVIMAAALIFVIAVRTWGVDRTRWARLVDGWVTSRILAVVPFFRSVPADAAEQPQVGRVLLIGTGAAVTVTAFAMAWITNYVQINTYVVLGLFGGGLLLLTWPSRADRHGRLPYSLAIVVAAVCALWAASLYAHNCGIQEAEQVAGDLPARTAVAVYTIQPLALDGPGVTVQRLGAGFLYHYRYEGLVLLTMRSGTYYLLPVRWSPQLDITYIISESDQTRIELYGGQSAG